MMRRTLALALSGTAMTAALVGISSGSASANAACGSTPPPDIDHSAYVAATASAVNIRTGSSTSCTSVGSLLAGQRIDYYCYTTTSTNTWSYLRDVATGKKGWVRDDNLPGDGSLVHC